MSQHVRIRTAYAVTLTAGALLAGCGTTSISRTGAQAPVSAESATQIEKLYEQVVATVLPSVVQINTDQGEGSGVVFDDQGHIVTNAHVVAGAKRFEVVPSSGGESLPAKLVGEFQAGDLAVIQVSGT